MSNTYSDATSEDSDADSLDDEGFDDCLALLTDCVDEARRCLLAAARCRRQLALMRAENEPALRAADDQMHALVTRIHKHLPRTVRQRYPLQVARGEGPRPRNFPSPSPSPPPSLAAPLTVQDLVRDDLRALTMMQKRTRALANVRRGVALGICADTWACALGDPVPLALQTLLTGQQALVDPGRSTMAAYTRQHQAICAFSQATSAQQLVHDALFKLSSAFFARRWYAASKHDATFATRFYSHLWASTPAGAALLAGADISRPDVYNTHKAAILKQVTRKHQRFVIARNRLLQLFAKHGPIVFLDPSWDFACLVSTTHGPLTMSAAANLDDSLPDDETRRVEYLRAEAALLSLFDAGFRFERDRERIMELLRGQLWELRTYASDLFVVA